MDDVFVSRGTTILGKRTEVIRQEIQEIRNGFTPEQIERLLMECARQEWFQTEHAKYWQDRFAEKSTGTAHW